MGISDKLIIGYDLNGDDMACLSILKQDKGKNKIVNSIFGSLAETLYDELCGVHDGEYKEISKQVEQLKAENAELKTELQAYKDKLSDGKMIELLTSEELEERLCNYCPISEEYRGMRCYGGNPVYCGGSRFTEAYGAYQDEVFEVVGKDFPIAEQALKGTENKQNG